MKSYSVLRSFWFEDELRQKGEVIVSTSEATEADRNAGNLAEEKKSSPRKSSAKTAASTSDKAETDK